MTFARYSSLQNRVAFITGGGSGIGASIVEAFVEQGAQVAFVDILEDESRALAERLAEKGKKPLFIACDLLDIKALDVAITTVRDTLGPIQVLVNNAANDTRQEVDAVTEADWDRTMSLNIKHQFFAAQAVGRQMRTLGAGSIINFSSIAWMGGAGAMTTYATAKAAVVGLTNSLAREFGPSNIRVNAIAPGAVITERQKRLWVSEDDMQMFIERQCMKRSLVPDDIARTALFLAADDSFMLTKQCIVVDGGLR
ncbi:dehydrogenase [Labrys miyagiensis]|uniref:Dehydrogenase n=1 Tax=Labrys miyagiensis TaxID=346912 RepID=A0ABQ6CGA8_9HYPH|nr:SDR family oxidoreductase [Labrys miyagiensis]GLS18713.1 dehydrogenase [Labrys miyagiensis]